MLTEESVLNKNSSVTVTSLPDGGSVAINSEERYFYTFNDSAVKVWELIDGRRDIGEICKKISLEYNLDCRQAHKIITGYVKKLLKANMVKIIK